MWFCLKEKNKITANCCSYICDLGSTNDRQDIWTQLSSFTTALNLGAFNHYAITAHHNKISFKKPYEVESFLRFFFQNLRSLCWLYCFGAIRLTLQYLRPVAAIDKLFSFSTNGPCVLRVKLPSACLWYHTRWRLHTVLFYVNRQEEKL